MSFIYSKLTPCHQDKYKYKCYNQYSSYMIIVCHKFPEVNSKIDELAYYITLNKNRIFYENDQNSELDSNIYYPDLISTFKDENCYISEYKIDLLRSKITNNLSDSVHLNIILPYDHDINIISIDLYGIE